MNPPPAPLRSVLAVARFVDGGGPLQEGFGPRSTSGEVTGGPVVPPPPAGVDDVDVDRGWPPRLRAAVTATPGWRGTAEGRPGARARRRSVDAAAAHPDLPRPVRGRWELLGRDLVRERPAPGGTGVVERVTLVNYADHQLVEVEVLGDGPGDVGQPTVRSVEQVALHRYRETPAEVEAAVELARGDPRLAERVGGLEAHGILQVITDALRPGEAGRCLRVVFTAGDDPHGELPVLFVALVDLHRKQVLGTSDSPCSGSTPRTG